jgi:hypothetical protein
MPLEAVRTGVWADRRLRYDGTAEAPIGRSPVGGFGWSIYFYLLFSSLPFTFYSCFIPFFILLRRLRFLRGGSCVPRPGSRRGHLRWRGRRIPTSPGCPSCRYRPLFFLDAPAAESMALSVYCAHYTSHCVSSGPVYPSGLGMGRAPSGGEWSGGGGGRVGGCGDSTHGSCSFTR